MNNLYRIEIKPFEDLTSLEVYELLKLRNKVFIVEQNCVYLDIDDKDLKAEHILFWKSGDLVAYARIFDIGVYFEKAAAIGRVIVHSDYRSFGLGDQLLKQALHHIDIHYKTSDVWISAQEYLLKFYNKHGFIQTSERYLEDGIPHIEMKRTKVKV